MELIVAAWNGHVPLGDTVLLLGITSTWVLAATILVTTMFRWDPRD